MSMTDQEAAATLQRILGSGWQVEPIKGPTTEPGAEGLPQLVIPGCERVTNATVAQMRADAPMRPKKEQSLTMPERGLWGDHGQMSLF